jgi:hypothetical protein
MSLRILSGIAMRSFYTSARGAALGIWLGLNRTNWQKKVCDFGPFVLLSVYTGIHKQDQKKGKP